MAIVLRLHLGLGGSFTVEEDDPAESLGSELVTNGTFDNATGWTLAGDGQEGTPAPTISGGVLQCGELSICTARTTAAATLLPSTAYRVTLDLTLDPGGNVVIGLGAGTSGAGTQSLVASGPYSFDLTTPGTLSNQLIRVVFNSGAASVDNLSVKQILLP